MAKLPKQRQQETTSPAKPAAAMQLAITNHHTAAIDVGSMLMMISYSDAQGNQCLLETDGYTNSLNQLARTLTIAGVTDVAMEATGIYWMALYEVLETAGLKVTLINPRHFKNVHAQKTDVKDCQWLHQLHAHGLLRASHIAPELYRELRALLHERNRAQHEKSDTLNRIHRTLSQMNLKVQHLLSDIEGVSGMALIRGIASGQTDPESLLEHIAMRRVKASREDLLQSLQGHYKPHLVTILKHHLRVYDFLVQEMQQFELLIESVLKRLLPPNENGEIPEIAPKTTKARKNQYRINLKGYLEKILGVDATAIDGFDEITVMVILSIIGSDMSKWPTAEHFASWLNLSPRPKKSGGKFLGHQRRYSNNAASQVIRLAAQTMWQHKGSLGNLYRRMAAQKGSAKAIKAVARRLAIIFYNMVKHQKPFDSTKVCADETKIKHRQIARLKKQAAAHGLVLQPLIDTSL